MKLRREGHPHPALGSYSMVKEEISA